MTKKNVKIIVSGDLKSLEQQVNELTLNKLSEGFELERVKLTAGQQNLATCIFTYPKIKYHGISKTSKCKLKMFSDKKIMNLEARINEYLEKMQKEHFFMDKMDIVRDFDKQAYVAILTMRSANLIKIY